MDVANLWLNLVCADHVYTAIKIKTKDALLRLIERERDGELVDRALIKNILSIFIEVRSQSIMGVHEGCVGACECNILQIVFGNKPTMFP